MNSPKSKDADRLKREEERRKRDELKAKQKVEIRTRLLEQKENKKKQKHQNQLSSSDQIISSINDNINNNNNNNNDNNDNNNEDDNNTKLSPEQRKKILNYRSARSKSRYRVPKNEQELKEMNEEEAKEQQQLQQKKQVQQQQEKKPLNDNEDKQDDNNDNNNDNVNDNLLLLLSEEEESKLYSLEQAFLKRDLDYYGFISSQEFVECLKESKLNISEQDQIMILKSLMILETGIDYYNFLRTLRVIGNKSKKTVESILQWLANEEAEREKKAQKKLEQKPFKIINDEQGGGEEEEEDDNNSLVSEDQDQDEDYDNFNDLQPKFDLKRFNSTTDLDPDSPLTQLINDLALDGADVDLALLKTAFSVIDVEPNEKDLETIINYLCTDESGFVDFRYFLQFLQEANNLGMKRVGGLNDKKSNMKDNNNNNNNNKNEPKFDNNISEMISNVAEQLRIHLRDEERRKQQEQKLKVRLEQRRASKLGEHNQLKDQIAEIEKEENKLRAARLREKAQQYR